MSDLSQTPWFKGVEGIDDAVIGDMQNRGWDKLDAAKAFAAAHKAWKSAETHLGAPADQILRLPKDINDPEAMKPVWQKLGAPTDPKEYDFSAIQTADKKPLDEKVADFYRTTAASLNLPKAVASKLVDTLVKHADASATENRAAVLANIEKEKADLAKNWGANAAANLQVAKNAAAALGIKPEAVTALESVVGYAQVMEMLRNIGSKIGEDKFITANNGSVPGVMSKEQAATRKNELMADPAWTKRYLEGGAAERREFDNLVAIIAA